MSEFVTLKDVRKIYRWGKLRSWQQPESTLRLRKGNCSCSRTQWCRKDNGAEYSWGNGHRYVGTGAG